MPTCVTTVAVYGFTAQTGTTRSTTSGVLQLDTVNSPSSSGCSMVALTPAEWASVQPMAKLTQAEINTLAAGVIALWATGWAVRFIRRQIPKN
jgi:hypothetical protein